MKKGQIGIELGTRNLRICIQGKEQFLKMKNLIAMDCYGKISAIGNEAFLMLEKEPREIQMIAPVHCGVIGDYTNMRLLLTSVFRKYFRHFRKYTVNVAIPVDITGVERRAFSDLIWESVRHLREVHLIPKPVLAAMGNGIDVSKPSGNLIVDFGAGTTEISVISLGGIVSSRLIPFGGNQIDQWLVHQMKREYNINIGKKSAERLKMQYSKCENDKSVIIKGRDLVSGLPRKTWVPVLAAEKKVRDYIHEITMETKALLEIVPPELASDIIAHGIYTSGGGAAFSKAESWMEEELGIQVHSMKEPEDSVIRGLKILIDECK
ncbi:MULTISPECIES: rod shape-determining protein [Anaerostipes]|uniref:rod shape-determining protein n=1 Tax=Anaerostipes TaxID=207244 RepID=UPI001C1E5F96|nr:MULTISPECIES: rod shape-determining protein [Anaerostipes]MCI5622474.1 rod shape-determining protein [Anaerostipes sp.]MDY2725920.1 rod shape-determining protein [Anaerostipes faecalis]